VIRAAAIAVARGNLFGGNFRGKFVGLGAMFPSLTVLISGKWGLGGNGVWGEMAPRGKMEPWGKIVRILGRIGVSVPQALFRNPLGEVLERESAFARNPNESGGLVRVPASSIKARTFTGPE
jgi:hypothetical protein